ncbi:hypothetical protein BT69DRAFT_70021 [Atractiella rhizophila]|nr:hypothetical protein BT69DRAFT_70021 [Atractiella rhizophila]
MSNNGSSYLALQKSLSLFLLSAGFQSSSTEALALLVHLTNFYIENLSLSTKNYTEHAGRAIPTTKDVIRAVEGMGVATPDELLLFLENAGLYIFPFLYIDLMEEAQNRTSKPTSPSKFRRNLRHAISSLLLPHPLPNRLPLSSSPSTRNHPSRLSRSRREICYS